MHKYVYITGKSCTGKDSIYHQLIDIIKNDEESKKIDFQIPFTTRQKRDYERDGYDYHFISTEEFNSMILDNKFASHQSFRTSGDQVLLYGHPKIDNSKSTHFKICTFQNITEEIKSMNSDDEVFVFNIILPPIVHAERIFKRNSAQENPNWEEVIRRTITDAEDYSEAACSFIKISLEEAKPKALFRYICNTSSLQNAAYSIIFQLQAFGVLENTPYISRECILNLN